MMRGDLVLVPNLRGLLVLVLVLVLRLPRRPLLVFSQGVHGSVCK